MGNEFRFASVALVLGACIASPANGQDNTRNNSVVLPPIDVTSSRIGTGIVGTSTTVITADEIAGAPEMTLQEILSREAGIQTVSLFGGVNGTASTVDVRGFGVTSPSNVLVLVDGRRFNDSDLTGFDFSLIPRNSIDRIEITRGNSGGVLYGDGAVGGVINIVTKNGIGQAPNARIEGAFGSLGTGEAKISASGSYKGFSGAAFGNAFQSDGYRDHNLTMQEQGVGDFRYRTNEGSVFFNISGDNLRQQLPGPRNIANGPFVGNFNEYVTDRRGTNTPLDFGNRQNVAVRGGITRNLWNGAELIVDGSVRQKDTQFASFAPLNGFLPPNIPTSYNETELTTMSVTPRVNIDQTFGDVRATMIAGVDVYKTKYESDRAAFQGARPNHLYDMNQTTIGGYALPTFTLYNNTDVAAGARLQYNSFHARDNFDPTAPVGPLGANPQGLPLDTSETDHALHIGVEHRFNPVFAVFARAAHSFRLPNIDERVGMAPVLTVTNFNLRTQQSNDYEAGIRVRWNGFSLQSSAYNMYLTDELHFSPITFANTNLDPTHRYGVENAALYQLTENVLLKGTLSYTRAVFRSGPFAGKDVPEVARWSGSAGVSWNIYQKYLVFDGVLRFVGKRFMDGDEANTGALMVPAHTVVDLRLGGEGERLFWALSVQNVFNQLYFDYGLDTSFPGNQFFSVYPLPGRTVLLRAGAKF